MSTLEEKIKCRKEFYKFARERCNYCCEDTDENEKGVEEKGYYFDTLWLPHKELENFLENRLQSARADERKRILMNAKIYGSPDGYVHISNLTRKEKELDLKKFVHLAKKVGKIFEEEAQRKEKK